MGKNKRIQSYQDRDACAASRVPFQTLGMLIGKCMASLFCQLMFIAIMSTTAWPAPQISISTDVLAFSPNGDGVLDTLKVYYDINVENVEKSEMVILRVTETSAGATTSPIGQPIKTNRTWRGRVGGKQLPDGIYRLRLQVTLRDGDSPDPVDTGNITIDTEPPRIPLTGIVTVTETGESVLTDGIFVNQAIRAIKVTPDKGESIGTDINFDADAAQVILKKEGTDV